MPAADCFQTEGFSERDIQLYTALKQRFGFDSFLPGQLEGIRAIMRGENTLINLAAGGGKSLCFQLPADLSGGTTIVVSPLIALIRNQRQSLERLGFKVGAHHSGQGDEENEFDWRMLQLRKLDFFYLSPEALNTKLISGILKEVRPDFFVLDEAHCISQWGHHFRPDYLRLARTIREITPDAQIAALTATAPEPVRKEILSTLKMEGATVVLGPVDLRHIEPNVVWCPNEAKKEQKILDTVKQLQRDGHAWTVYCSRIESVERLQTKASLAGVRSRGYHAGLDADHRREIEEHFLSDKVSGLFATSALGMGFDKRNIRFVGHSELPETLERYYQEMARGGRDWNPARASLFIDPYDIHSVLNRVVRHYPTSQEMKLLFSLLYSFVPEEKRNESEPWIRFDERRFIDRSTEYRKYPPRLRTALIALEEHALIANHGMVVRFLRRPDDFNDQAFPITDEMMEDRREKEKLAIKKVLVYAGRAPNGFGEAAWNKIVSHFDHDGLAEAAAAFTLPSVLESNREGTVAILRELDSSDYTIDLLTSRVSTAQRKTAQLIDLKEYQARELRLLIGKAIEEGFVDSIDKSGRQFITVSRRGCALLNSEQVERATMKTRDELIQRILHPETSDYLRGELTDWFHRTRTVLGQKFSLEAVGNLLYESSFDLNVGFKVSGKQLAQAFSKANTLKQTTPLNAKSLVFHLFRDLVETP